MFLSISGLHVFILSNDLFSHSNVPLIIKQMIIAKPLGNDYDLIKDVIVAFIQGFHLVIN